MYIYVHSIKLYQYNNIFITIENKEYKMNQQIMNQHIKCMNKQILMLLKLRLSISMN